MATIKSVDSYPSLTLFMCTFTLCPHPTSSCHVLPLLLNLLESRDLHVRLVLLENISGFAPIIRREELTDTVLPEVNYPNT